MDTGQWLVIGLCAFLLLWYLIGWLFNRRRGHAVLVWLKTGLGTLGKPGDTRWLSPLHSSAQVIVAEAHSPFRKVGGVFVLEPRENLPVWAFRHALGRRDELYLRADLRSTPAQEIEVARKGRSEIAALVKPGKDDPYLLLPGTDVFNLARRGKIDDQVVERVKVFLTTYEDAVLRLSIQRSSPHLIVRARLSPLQTGSCEQFIAALQAALK